MNTSKAEYTQIQICECTLYASLALCSTSTAFAAFTAHSPRIHRMHTHSHTFNAYSLAFCTDDTEVIETTLKELITYQVDKDWDQVKTLNKTELAALVKTLDKVKDLKATKVAEYGKACSVPDSCTSKAKKLAYLLGESLDRLR